MLASSKNSVKSKEIANRLEEYRLSLGLTWKQVAERLKLSVPMLIQVRSGLRGMGSLALRRFEEAEQSAKNEVRTRKVVERLLDDQGTARALIEQISMQSGRATIPLRYRRVTGSESPPRSVTLSGQDADVREKILTLFRRTLDPQILVLACIADARLDEDTLAKLTPACLLDLRQAALTLFFGSRWRSIVVKMALDQSGK